MSRRLSAIAAEWWDYTTLDRELIDDAARLTPRELARLSRPGFTVVLYDTFEEFYLAEALEYIDAWRASTDDNPVGICGPIGPTEQLPLVARIVNSLNLDIRSGHQLLVVRENLGDPECFASRARRFRAVRAERHDLVVRQRPHRRDVGGGGPAPNWADPDDPDTQHRSGDGHG